MNDVFLLMWLADIAGGIAFIGGACVVGGVLCVVFMGIGYMVDGDFMEDGALGRGIRKIAIWLLLPIGIAVVTPNPSTIKLLAAARAGELLAATKTGGKAIEAVNAVLDKIITTSKKD